MSAIEFESFRFKQDDFADAIALKLLKLGDHSVIHQAIQYMHRNKDLPEVITIKNDDLTKVDEAKIIVAEYFNNLDDFLLLPQLIFR